MPPVTITTSVRIRIGSPMPGCTDTIGPAISPARPASAGAQAEHQRVEPAHVDAERRDDVRVRRAGADQHADARAVDQQVEPEADGEADAR